ncbi:hypothetical protein [Pseudanabaena sp. 'Roaring Creek']|uniref:hypothetical protein n=1 Tax=Pseudanabaena sp. 'Roaring Creek' TaxID=1681830 RepID=UPI0006D7DB3E|nr:hypothetical protein [Pseudanabaena sp. 'Roaring Creek']
MITGVSLNFCAPRCITLSRNESNRSYMPLALPVSGQYDYLGGVELYGGDRKYLINLFYPDINIEYESSERIDQRILSILNGYNALILESVWNAIARNYPSYRNSNIDNLKSVFHPQAKKLILNYRNHRSYYHFEDFVEDKLLEREEQGIEPLTTNEIEDEYLAYCLENHDTSEVAIIDQFLRDHNLCWHPSETIPQHPEPEIRQYLQEAKENFSDSPTIIDALLSYELEMESYIKEYEEIQRGI